jgi:hypothetical protein
VIVVPTYARATVTGTVGALAWDGASGGVVALDAGELVLSAAIDVSGQGFPGGRWVNVADAADATAYIRTGVGGGKGAGFAGPPDALPTGSAATGGEFNRGAPANAGGGGNPRNAGGGGGGGNGNGGRGGVAFSSLADVGGRGGRGYSGLGVVFGGGGGAGHSDNSTAGNGGAGGGAIVLRAHTISGASSLLASGTAGGASTNDGGGGGGGGGTVLVMNVAGTGPTVVAAGGAGGASNGSVGAGGGGGGGLVRVVTAAASVSATAGAGGAGGASNGGVAGSAGVPATSTAFSLPGVARWGTTTTRDLGFSVQDSRGLELDRQTPSAARTVDLRFPELVPPVATTVPGFGAATLRVRLTTPRPSLAGTKATVTVLRADGSTVTTGDTTLVSSTLSVDLTLPGTLTGADLAGLVVRIADTSTHGSDDALTIDAVTLAVPWGASTYTVAATSFEDRSSGSLRATRTDPLAIADGVALAGIRAVTPEMISGDGVVVRFPATAAPSGTSGAAASVRLALGGPVGTCVRVETVNGTTVAQTLGTVCPAVTPSVTFAATTAWAAGANPGLRLTPFAPDGTGQIDALRIDRVSLGLRWSAP